MLMYLSESSYYPRCTEKIKDIGKICWFVSTQRRGNEKLEHYGEGGLLLIRVGGGRHFRSWHALARRPNIDHQFELSRRAF